MAKIFLKGHRVMLDQPKMKELPFEVTEELKRAMIEEEMRKYVRLQIYAVGDEVKDFTPGMAVYVSPTNLAMAEVIDLDGDLKILVRAMDIAFIWEDDIEEAKIIK